MFIKYHRVVNKMYWKRILSLCTEMKKFDLGVEQKGNYFIVFSRRSGKYVAYRSAETLWNKLVERRWEELSYHLL